MSEETANGIHSEGTPTTAMDTTTPSQTISQPDTNISSIEANEHGLNFLSESEVESKPQVDQAQLPSTLHINESTGFGSAPTGDGWEESGQIEDNTGDTGMKLYSD